MCLIINLLVLSDLLRELAYHFSLTDEISDFVYRHRIKSWSGNRIGLFICDEEVANASFL